MTSSGTSTERGPSRSDSSFQPWHFFMLLAMLGATVAVWRSPETHPAALLLLSAAVIAAGFVGLAVYHALAGFVSSFREERVLSGHEREDLLRDKALVLRTIKELEFDHGMKKVSDADFAEIGGRLRARALDLMQLIEQTPAPPPEPAAVAQHICPACQTENDADARFCKQCGQALYQKQ